MVALEAAGTRTLHLLDEHADELGLFAVEAQRDATVGAVLPRGRRDLPHEEVEMAEVVSVGHRIGTPARRVRGEVQALVEHVVLERANPLLADEPIHLVQLLGRHHADVIPEVGVRAADRRRDDLGEDRPVGPALVEIVLPGAEVAEDRGHAARERGGRLAPRVGGEVAIDPDVEVRVYRPWEHQLAAGVHDGAGVARRDRVDQRGDAPGADADVAAQRAHVGNDDRAIQNGGIVAGHGEGVRTGGRSGPVSGR
jgi:hypothetical protein